MLCQQTIRICPNTYPMPMLDENTSLAFKEVLELLSLLPPVHGCGQIVVILTKLPYSLIRIIGTIHATRFFFS